MAEPLVPWAAAEGRTSLAWAAGAPSDTLRRFLSGGEVEEEAAGDGDCCCCCCCCCSDSSSSSENVSTGE